MECVVNDIELDKVRLDSPLNIARFPERKNGQLNRDTFVESFDEIDDFFLYWQETYTQHCVQMTS